MKPDQERVKHLLTESVTLLCKTGLQFEKELKVQGVLRVTLDGNEEFVVQFDESCLSPVKTEVVDDDDVQDHRDMDTLGDLDNHASNLPAFSALLAEASSCFVFEGVSNHIQEASVYPPGDQGETCRAAVLFTSRPSVNDAARKINITADDAFANNRTSKRSQTCDICGVVLKNPSYLIIHKRKHTGEKPYACNLCDKAFAVKGTLNNHMRLHTGEFPHSCETCGKAFILPRDLAAHIRTHTGELPYACDLCDKAFAAKISLTNHVRLHTGEEMPQFSCDVCNKTFSRPARLTKHRLLHEMKKAKRGVETARPAQRRLLPRPTC